MKKIFFAIAIIFTMSFSLLAQRTDNFWADDNVNRVDDDLPWLTTIAVGLVLTDNDANNNPHAPLGSGLLVLTGLGAGYAFLRKKSKK